MYCKIFALHFKSCPMTYCMSIIPKKKLLVPITTKNKGPCLLCFCLVLSLLTFDFEHCSLKALSQPVSFLQCVHGVLKLIESPWDRKEICSCGVLLRFLYLVIDSRSRQIFTDRSWRAKKVFSTPCLLCALRVVVFFQYWWFNFHLYNCIDNKQEFKL